MVATVMAIACIIDRAVDVVMVCSKYKRHLSIFSELKGLNGLFIFAVFYAYIDVAHRRFCA